MEGSKRKYCMHDWALNFQIVQKYLTFTLSILVALWRSLAKKTNELLLI